MEEQGRPPTAAAPAPGPSISNANANATVLPVVIVDPGPLGMTLVESGASTVIGKVKPNSQADRAGVQAGDWPVSPMGKKIPYAEFHRMCVSGTRPLAFQVARSVVSAPTSVAAKDPPPPKASSAPGSAAARSTCTKNENAPNGTGAPVAPAKRSATTGGATAAALQPPPAKSVTALLAMSNKELHAELRSRNIKVAKAATKDIMLGKLGVPAAQWKAFRKMKVTQLKEELKRQGKTVTGTKEQLLDRLGVPKGFGETYHEKLMREIAEDNRASKKREKEAFQSLVSALKKAKRSDPEDDPAHEMYSPPCCGNPSFPKWGDRTQPCGYVDFPDGSMMEVWRCVACGKVPTYPNAPPIHVYPSDDEDGSSGTDSRGPGDCVIQ